MTTNTPRIYIESREFKKRQLNAVEQYICTEKGQFRIRCEFIEFSFSKFEHDMSFHHPCPPFARIFVMKKGKAILEYCGKRKILKEGKIYLLPENMEFQSRYLKGSDLKAFHVRLSDNHGFTLPPDSREVEELDCKWIFESINAAVIEGDQLKIQASLMPLATEFLKPFFPLLEKRSESGRPEKRMLEYLQDKAAASVRISDMAREFKISRSALSKSFQRAFGVSLKSYIMQNCLDKAKKLLIESNMTVNEISVELGYQEAAYFHIFFKKNTGVTPLNYRVHYRKRIS